MKLHNITTIKFHNKSVRCVSTFPSGNIISISDDCSIIIYNYIHFNIIQKIIMAHFKGIIQVEIIDENLFITCSFDKNIKFWKKIDNKFSIYKKIENAHCHLVSTIIYCSNGNLISGGGDQVIKIWKKNKENSYEIIHSIIESYSISDIYFLEDKNLLIYSRGFKAIFRDISDFNQIKLLKYFNNITTNNFCRINNDRIILENISRKEIFIISIKELNIIKQIQINFIPVGITFIKNKEIILIGEFASNDIKIYDINNFECVQIINKAHNSIIGGFIELKNGMIASFSCDSKVKIWSF